MGFKKLAEKIARRASGKRALAVCASVMIMFGVTQASPSSAAFAKTSSISNFFSKLLPKKAKKDKKPAQITEEEIQKKREKLTEQLDAKIQGKEQVKEQIMDFFECYSWDRLDLQGDRNYTDRQLPCTRIYIFNGENDQEKEDAAVILGQAIAGDNLVTINADDIKGHEKDKGFYSDYEDAFMHGDIIKDQTNSHGAKNLSKYLKQTEGKDKVIVIKKFDELYDQPGAIGRTGVHPMDEMLRSILDERWRDKKGKSVDISGLTIICMTNETKASLQGRIEFGCRDLVELQLDEDGEVIYDESGDPLYAAPTPDGNKAIIPHDKSLFCRIAHLIVRFD